MIIAGLFFYSLDIPRIARKFQRALPTEQIKSTHPRLPDEQIEDSYFDFYDELEVKYKYKHEKYSGYFHLTSNMTAASLLTSAMDALSAAWHHWTPFLLISVSIFILSSATSVIIYHTRLTRSYRRHLQKYYLSSQYHTLITPAVTSQDSEQARSSQNSEEIEHNSSQRRP